MTFISLLLIRTASAVVVNTSECISVSQLAKQCCDDPVSEGCLDDPARALNDKLKSLQDSISRRTSGVHDATFENKAKGELMRLNGQLNLRSADHCDQLAKECLAKCANLNASEAHFALGRCQGLPKLAEALREQAGRDEAAAKRLTRGK